MEHRLIAAGPALALLLIGFGSAPAFAYNANQFKDACAIVAGCTSGTTVKGYTYGDSGGTHYDCPPVGHKPSDACIILRVNATTSPVVFGLSNGIGNRSDDASGGGSGGGSGDAGGTHFTAPNTISGLPATTGPRYGSGAHPLN